MKSNSNEWFSDPSYWANNRSVMWNADLMLKTSKDVTSVIDLLETVEGDSLLDLACGFGRHSLLFEEHGLNVTGVDLNPDFIDEAIQEATKQNKNARLS